MLTLNYAFVFNYNKNEMKILTSKLIFILPVIAIFVVNADDKSKYTIYIL